MFMKLKRLGTFLLTVVVVSGGAHAVEKKASVLTTDNLKAYVARFNADDASAEKQFAESLTAANSRAV
jgi:hypothetical protein